MSSEFERGFQAGFELGSRTSPSAGFDYSEASPSSKSKKATKSRPQKGKAKVLTSMTAPVWAKYKKGKGKKTYVEIRAQVSKSQAYRRKTKGMK